LGYVLQLIEATQFNWSRYSV